jgi:alkylation response protein AidB-like acyl-CoA dehydrogenase
MAKALLAHERTGIGGVAESGRFLQLAKRIAAETPVGEGRLLDDPGFRRKVARLQVRHRAVAMLNYRTLAAAQVGRAPGFESSVLKIVGTEVQQETTELCMDAMGHNALGWIDSPPEALPESQRAVASQFNYLRAATIYGGSNEIQKNIIAKQMLRLPS